MWLQKNKIKLSAILYVHSACGNNRHDTILYVHSAHGNNRHDTILYVHSARGNNRHDTILYVHSARGNNRHDTILTLVDSSWITCCSDGAPTGMLGRSGWKIRHSIVESVWNTVLIEKRAAVNGGRRSSFIRSVEWLR
jgi:hypothetical protein